MLRVNQKPIDFKTTDVFDNPISISQYKGKRLLLSFMRYSGCPVCNLHVHQLLQRQLELKENNIEVIFIYESSKQTLLKYIENEKLPFTFVSDSTQKLYDLYMVEKSWIKLLKTFTTLKGLKETFQGLMKYKKFSSMKGSMNRVGAEFLINPNGIIERVHYGSMVGDHLPLSHYLST